MKMSDTQSKSTLGWMCFENKTPLLFHITAWPQRHRVFLKIRFGTQEIQNITQINPLGFHLASLYGHEALGNGEKDEVCRVVIQCFTYTCRSVGFFFHIMNSGDDGRFSSFMFLELCFWLRSIRKWDQLHPEKQEKKWKANTDTKLIATWYIHPQDALSHLCCYLWLVVLEINTAACMKYQKYHKEEKEHEVREQGWKGVMKTSRKH